MDVFSGQVRCFYKAEFSCLLGSPYRMLLSRAVLRLQQDGVLTKLKELWWKTKGGGKCDDEDSQSAASGSELGLPNVGGVFVVLLGGMGLACIVGVMEFVWKTRKTVQEERVSNNSNSSCRRKPSDRNGTTNVVVIDDRLNEN